MKNGKLFCTVLILMLTVSLFSNGNNEDAAGAAADFSTVTMGIPVDVGEITPFGAPGYARTYTQYLCYERMAYDSGEGTDIDVISPWLAKKWYRPEGEDLTVVVEIFDNIYDRAGNHFTAEDAVWSLEMMKDSGFYENLTYLVSSEVIDEYTYTYTINSYNVGMLTYPLLHVNNICRTTYEANVDSLAFTTAPITTSAYYVSEFVPGSHITFSKNEDYWQKDASLTSMYAVQNVDKIVLNVITDPAQTAIALETGDVDMVASLDATEVNRFLEKDGKTSVEGYKVYNELSHKTNSIWFNNYRGTITGDSLELRQAILYGIDREGILQAVVRGKGITTNALGHPKNYDYVDEWNNWNRYPYDPDRARSLLADAGYEPGELTLRIMCSANVAWHTGTAEVIQAYLLDMGINSELLTYDNALYYQYMKDPALWDIMIDYKGGIDFVTNHWATAFNPNSYKFGGCNFIEPENDPEFYKLLNECSDARTHDDETLMKFMTYNYDQAYAAGIFVADVYSASTDAWDVVHAGSLNLILPNMSTASK